MNLRERERRGQDTEHGASRCLLYASIERFETTRGVEAEGLNASTGHNASLLDDVSSNIYHNIVVQISIFFGLKPDECSNSSI